MLECVVCLQILIWKVEGSAEAAQTPDYPPKIRAVVLLA